MRSRGLALPGIVSGSRTFSRSLRLHLDHQRNPAVFVSFNIQPLVKIWTCPSIKHEQDTDPRHPHLSFSESSSESHLLHSSPLLNHQIWSFGSPCSPQSPSSLCSLSSQSLSYPPPKHIQPTIFWLIALFINLPSLNVSFNCAEVCAPNI